MSESLNGIVGTPEQQSALLAAIAKAQCAMEGAKRDKVNPHLKNKYATLESVIDAVKPALKDNGLSFQQMPTFVCAQGQDRAAYVEVTTTIAHQQGGVWAFVTELPVKPNPNAQEVGSSFTYAKRYALQSFWGIPSEDDDGNDASGRKSAAKTPAADPMAAWVKAIGDKNHPDQLRALAESLKTRDNLTEEQKTELRGLIEKKATELKGKSK